LKLLRGIINGKGRVVVIEMFDTPKKALAEGQEAPRGSQNRPSASKSVDRFIPQQIKSDLFAVMKVQNYESDLRVVENQDSKLNHNLVEERKLRCFDLLLQKEVIKKPLWREQSKEDSFRKKSQRRLFSFGDFKIEEDMVYFEENSLERVREVHSTPYKILDAPGLTDDFYLNVLDWTQNNLVVVALGNNLYNWCPTKGKATKMLAVTSGDTITSLRGNAHGNKLALGYASGRVKILDFEKQKIETTFKSQIWRVGSLSWAGTLISSGSRDKSVHINDLRVNPTNDSPAFAFNGHKQEVCGLSFSPSSEMLASGGNDNRFIIWDLRKASELFVSTKHTAAVKAIDWSPHKHNLVLSGGGTHDQTIKVWNTHTCGLMSSIDSGSQVCAIKFSPNVNEFVSAHGYSQNHVNVWSLNQGECTKFAVLQGHSSRVLYLAVSPDGRNVVTGAGDESLRFWDVFPTKPAPKENLPASDLKLNFSEIR